MAGDDEAPPNPKIDSTSPYYLGSLAVPEAKISNVVLRRENYDDWKNSMRMSLKSRRKFGFIDGSIKKPTDPFYLENWEVVHCTLVQWIRNTIDPSLLDTISYVEDASVLWNDLAAQFSVVDGTVIHNLKTQIKNCVQTKDAVKRQDSERLHQFLMGLDSTLYGHIRSQQLQLNPLPSLTRVYHAVLQEERLRASPTAVDDASDVVAFATPRPPLDSRNQERGERRGLFCHLCDTRGHELHNCYIKSQRFPEWWGDRPRTLADLRRSRANKASRGTSFTSAGRSGTGTAAASDRSLKTTIGVGELRDGLYWIRACSVSAGIHQVSASGSRDLWYRRLGHPSDHVVKTVPFASSLNFNKDWVCDVCHLAKQHRNSFSNNEQRALDIFDLIHCDLWGPYRIPSSCGANYTAEGGDATAATTGETEGGVVGDTGTAEGVIGDVTEDAPSTATGDATGNGTATDDAIGRGHRKKFPNSRLQGYVLQTTRNPSPSSSSSTSSASSSGTPYDLANYINCNSFSESHRNFIAAITSGIEPPSFKEAIRDNDWCEVMKAEIDALERNNTWELTDLPTDKKALGCWWVYKIKYKSDGTIERLKARLVVFGNHQVEGLDYGETFAPVVKMVTIRAFLSVAAVKNWELHQMDVHNAFLHGDLDEEVYMRLPPGFSRGKEGKVCRLKKSLYGLRQAPRCWFAKLTASLKNFGFVQSYSDYSLFYFSRGTVRLFVLIYMDDLVIAGNDPSEISKFKAYLSDCFHMKDLGKLKYFLGLEVSRSKEGIYLSQRKYALDIISETGLLGSKPVATPIEQNHRLGLASGPPSPDAESYRRLIGRLVYLAVTRPDLSYAVHILSHFLSNPGSEHMAAAHRVVRYLKGSPGQGILLRADSSLSLRGWCDSDWGGCPTSRRSITGWFVTLGDSPISWKTKKQQTVSLSAAEAEYRSMAQLVYELKWLKCLLSSLDVAFAAPISIFSNSKSALDLARNPVFHERTKHIEIDCHFIRDAITDGLVLPTHVSTTDQLADIFTKALGVPQFTYLLRKLGILDLHAPA
ncbi:uncharacterized protein LOC141617305 [Silene latifolia]|uniref:uncharacterized protein LOC141617305 n=1 Tax=Silene latifolia TaxID=37657 RepID=UPI003D77193F